MDLEQWLLDVGSPLLCCCVTLFFVFVISYQSRSKNRNSYIDLNALDIKTSGFGSMVAGRWISLALLLSHFKVVPTLESNPTLLLSSYKVHQNFTFGKCLPVLALICWLPKSNPRPRPASQIRSIYT